MSLKKIRLMLIALLMFISILLLWVGYNVNNYYTAGDNGYCLYYLVLFMINCWTIGKSLLLLFKVNDDIKRYGDTDLE